MAQFNALVTAQNLEGAGMERRQAEAVAVACSDAPVADRAELATKDDIATLTWRIFAALFANFVATVGLLVAVLDRLP